MLGFKGWYTRVLRAMRLYGAYELNVKYATRMEFFSWKR